MDYSSLFKVLLVDDHQIIIDTYKSVLNEYVSKYGVKLCLDEAHNCRDGYQKITFCNKTAFYQLVFLDIQIPSDNFYGINSGEDLGQRIRAEMIETKIIVCTSYTDNFRLLNIIQNVNPEGLLVKGDISYSDLIQCIEHVVEGKTFYSQSVVELLRKRVSSLDPLDSLDIKILHEISNGSKMKDLLLAIPLSKAGIEKRKRLMKEKLEVHSDNDRDLILTAKEKGFI